MAKRKKTAATVSPSPPASASPDPLAVPRWPSSARSDEEREERARFERIWAAFARGDFGTCRREARALAESAQEEEVRIRALALVERLRPDPLAVAVAGGAMVVFFIALFSAYG